MPEGIRSKTSSCCSTQTGSSNLQDLIGDSAAQQSLSCSVKAASLCADAAAELLPLLLLLLFLLLLLLLLPLKALEGAGQRPL